MFNMVAMCFPSVTVKLCCNYNYYVVDIITLDHNHLFKLIDLVICCSGYVHGSSSFSIDCGGMNLPQVSALCAVPGGSFQVVFVRNLTQHPMASTCF